MFNILFRLHGVRPERKQFRLKLAIECGIILTVEIKIVVSLCALHVPLCYQKCLVNVKASHLNAQK